jgi:hypothetical protein
MISAAISGAASGTGGFALGAVMAALAMGLADLAAGFAAGFAVPEDFRASGFLAELMAITLLPCCWSEMTGLLLAADYPAWSRISTFAVAQGSEFSRRGAK